jgi:5'-nucleotidase
LKTILLTNDDGYESEGLHLLQDALKGVARLVVVAPSTEKSACGHSLTLTKPLKLISVRDDFFKCDDGTPSDCIYLALNTLFEDKKPDLVISGINKGSNLGEDITYSGTAAAAMEAVLHDVPAIAISQVFKEPNHFDFTLAARFIAQFATKILQGGFPLPPREFININVPAIDIDKYKGYKVTNAGYRYYANDAHLHRNPRGEEYYWLGLHPLEWKQNATKSCDFSAIDQGYISISPIMLDLTAYRSLETLSSWGKSIEI